MKKEIATYLFVFCLFGMIGVGVVHYFGPEKTTSAQDACTMEEKKDSPFLKSITTPDKKSCETQKEEKIID